MTPARILLLAVAVACLTSPALAGTYRTWSSWNPWLEPWTCSAYEFAHKCNALWHPRASHCRCMAVDDMGWRLNEYYGPKAQNLAPRDVQQ